MSQRSWVYRAVVSAMVVLPSAITLSGCATIEGLFSGNDPPRPCASVLPPPICPPKPSAGGETTTAGGRRPQNWRADLVEAEARLQRADFAGAEAIALRVANRPECAARGAAYLLLGKACIADGRFQQAEEALAKARTADQRTSGPDVRVDDLVALARGLEAWSRGDVDVARAYSRAIHDQRMRAYLSAQFGPSPASAAGRSR